MAEASPELREIPYLRLFPWTRLFQGVAIATDGKKLILAGLGLGLLLAGWGVLDLLFPGSAEITLRLSGAPLPSPFDSQRPLTATLADAAATVADPPRTLIAPFLAVFSLSPAPGVFWHAALSALWAVAVWGIIGGAIARIAVVQVATGESVGLVAALRFSLGKSAPLIEAPLIPLLGVACFAALCGLMGLFYRIPSTIVHSALGLLAFLPLLAGVVMAIIVLGLAAGWPLMHATIAAEGEDAFDALSRTYAYVYQRPGRYAAYTMLAWAFGTIGLFVVVVFARAVVRLALWGLSLGAPDSLLFALFQPGPSGPSSTPEAIHSGWLTLVSLLAYGWVYSYFWTSAAIIYLLLRHDVDGTDWNDIEAAEPEGSTLPAEPEAAPTQTLATSPEPAPQSPSG